MSHAMRVDPAATTASTAGPTHPAVPAHPAAPAAPPVERWLDVDGLWVHTVEWRPTSDSAPPVVLVHGRAAAWSTGG